MMTTISLVFLMKQSLSTGTDWDYEHMSEWSDSFPMCDNEQQSPIDIESSQVINDSEMCNSFFDWDIQYDITNFQLTNSGHFIILKPVTESHMDSNNDLSSSFIESDGIEYSPLTLSENAIAKFPNYFKPTDSSHDQFCLNSIHFHWGLNDTTGSEHLLNGYQYPLEAHFVHFSCKHASLETTLEQFTSESSISDDIDAHQLSVVGIFFDVIEDYINPAFEIFLNENMNALDMLPGHDNKIIHALNLKDLIPDSVQTDGYYAYEGSFTTPPCTSIVRWHIMNATGKIGKSQMEQLRKIYLREEGVSMVSIAPNYRETQNNVNEVYGCMSAPQNMEENTQGLSIVELVIISCVVTAIIIGVISLMIKVRSVKRASKLTKSNSANDLDEQEQYNIPQKLQSTTNYDTSQANKRMSIDI